MRSDTGRTLFFAWTLLLLGGDSAFTKDLKSSQKPNFLIMTADNLGYGDVGCYGNPKVKTPNIDKLASDGVRLTDFYTASPTCTVSRACLLTGRYPQRHGLTAQLPGIEGNYGEGLSQSEVILPKLLNPLGYRTGCFGKWNIGFAPGSRPTERGFDEFFGHASGNIDYFTHVYNQKLDMHRGIEPVQVEGYSTDLFADEAIAFIKKNRDYPFFVYLPFNAPHFPNPRNKQPGDPCIWQAPDRDFETYGWSAEETDEKRRYYTVITAMDRAIGRVLQNLDQMGLAQNTVVIFFSDNGAFMLENRGLEVASNQPFRNGGVTLYEGGIRVPCIVRWPGKIKAGTLCDAPLISLDWFPMLVAHAGGKVPQGLTLDGADPSDALFTGADSPHESLFFEYGNYQAMRKGNFKILRTESGGPFSLYDLDRDPGETTDLAQSQPELLRRTVGEFDVIQLEMNAEP